MSLQSHLGKDLRLIFRDVKGLVIALLLPAVIVGLYSLLELGDITRSGRSPDALILVLSTAFPVLLIGSTSLVSERRAGTFQRLARTPANLFSLVAAKSLAALLLVAVQVGIILFAASALLQPETMARPVGLASVLLATGFGGHALGLVLSASVSTETQASQLTALLLLLMLTLSGFLQPLEDLGTVGAVAGFAPVARGYMGAQEVLAGTAFSVHAALGAVVGVVLLAVAGTVSFLRQ